MVPIQVAAYDQLRYAGYVFEGNEMTNPETVLPAPNLSGLTAEIVAAYVANNSVPAGNLPELIATVHAAVSGLSKSAVSPAEEPTPAVNPKRSVHADHIICLEDGKRFKSLKRHLMTHYGMTPEEYRAKWGLPHDYPMVAPNYAAARSELAKKMGLGRKAKKPARRRK